MRTLAATVAPLVPRLLDRVGYRRRSLLVAAALAVLAALLTHSYVQSYKSGVDASVAAAPVFVAARDVPAGTPGSALLGGGALRLERVPRKSVVPGAIASRDRIATLVAAEPIYAGEQITTRRFRPAAEQGIRGELAGTLRALSLSGDPDQVLAGVLADGDRVDVVASLKYTLPDGRAAAAARTVLRDVVVLTAPGRASDGGGLADARARSRAVLALTDAQARKLFYVMRNGDWTLVLRPSGRGEDGPDRVETVGSLVGGAG